LGAWFVSVECHEELLYHLNISPHYMIYNIIVMHCLAVEMWGAVGLLEHAPIVGDCFVCYRVRGSASHLFAIYFLC